MSLRPPGPAVWTIVLPTLDPVFCQATDMAVTALATGGAQNYALVLRGPRYVDAVTGCAGAERPG